MKNDNEERLIEFLVTIGALIFFALLSMYVMRGYSNEHSFQGDLAPSTAITTAVPTTAIAEIDIDTDTNLSSEGMVDEVTITTEVITKEPEVKEVTAVDSNLSTGSVMASSAATIAEADDNQSDKTEAEEEAGIIDDIESGTISSKPYILKGVYFRTGSSVLTAKSKRQLDAIAKTLKSHKDVIITLRGHTDKMGSVKNNEALSSKRAASVGHALVERGANIDNIWTKGIGESEPITSNSSAKEMSKNRRVDIAVTK